MNTLNVWKRWSVVAVFALAMAWVEAAVVLYLRTLLNRIEPYQPRPLPEIGGLAGAELIREAATLVMLATVGWLAGTTMRSRAAYALVAFGVWDIAYYVFLVPLTGWPNSLLDWDILFLLPLPWWGPVVAPVSIAALMIAGGTLVARYDSPEQPLRPGWIAGALAVLGTVLALYVFMADAIEAIRTGGPSVRDLLPVRFLWPAFLVALALMAAPVLELAWRCRRRTTRTEPDATRPPVAGTSGLGETCPD
jgi:hypothetical protein